jgi:hypothetical protein
MDFTYPSTSDFRFDDPRDPFSEEHFPLNKDSRIHPDALSPVYKPHQEDFDFQVHLAEVRPQIDSPDFQDFGSFQANLKSIKATKSPQYAHEQFTDFANEFKKDADYITYPNHHAEHGIYKDYPPTGAEQDDEPPPLNLDYIEYPSGKGQTGFRPHTDVLKSQEEFYPPKENIGEIHLNSPAQSKPGHHRKIPKGSKAKMKFHGPKRDYEMLSQPRKRLKPQRPSKTRR